MESVQSQFHKLCIESDLAYGEELEGITFESVLIKILNFIKANPEHRSFFISELKAIISGGKIPFEIIEFTMRELRWPEIQQFIIGKIENHPHPILCNSLRRALNAYEEVWENEDLYEYYQPK
jgi:hypothetical protein